jgi:hypothetical protein
VKIDQRGSTVLSEEECRRYLTRAAATGIGRIAINGVRSPHMIPVNFSMIGTGIVIRLGPGWAAFHLDGVAVTFEADEAARYQHSGWSVLVEGIARSVPYEEAARLGDNVPSPMVPVPGVRVFEIIPFKVSGRAVEPGLRGEESNRAAGSVERTGDRPRNLHLDPAAVEELTSQLRSVLGDLSSEIADTDNAAFRRELVRRRRILEDIAGQLSGTGPT